MRGNRIGAVLVSPGVPRLPRIAVRYPLPHLCSFRLFESILLVRGHSTPRDTRFPEETECLNAAMLECPGCC